MKPKIFSLPSLSIVSLWLLVTPTHGQVEYYADGATVVSAANPVQTNRLFLRAGTLAPTNTTIWFVADTGANGVPTNPPANQVLGPDDVLVYADVVDGTILGNQPGRFSRRSILVRNIVSTNAEVYVYLWNGQGAAHEPQPGSTFGLFRIGVVPVPQIGNAQWLITENVRADQQTVGSVVLLPPSITRQPTDQTVDEGGTATFTVEATGTAPLGYQWRRNGTDLDGQTNATLTLMGVTQADAGPYRVVVANSVSNVLSDPAMLTVRVPALPPSITQQPTNQTVDLGGTATFVVQAAGTPPLSYQWQKDGADRGGATNATLTLTNVAQLDAGTYRVLVANSVTNLLSDAATLVVRVPATLSNATATVSEQDVVFRFDFSTLLGASYRVQSATNLASSPIMWESEADSISGTGTTVSHSTTNALAGSPQRFYRVVTE
jgi:hypothetical protein